MKKNFKTMAATGMMVLTIVANAMPSFAAEIKVKNSETIYEIPPERFYDCILERMPIDDKVILVDPSKRFYDCILERMPIDDEVILVESYIDTLVNSGITEINVGGRNIDITNLDATNIHDSMIVTVLKQKASIINAQEIMKKLKG